MNPTVVGIVVFACAFCGALGGIRLRTILPDQHLSDESRDTIKVGIGLIATMTALVLGLVTASAKSSFDEQNRTIKHTAADILSLDRVLAQYGPETAEIRKAMKLALAGRIEMMWSQDQSQRACLEAGDAARGAELLAGRLRGLTPQTDDQRWLRSRALDLSERVLEARWLVFAGHSGSVPVAFLVTLVFWLTITFASFGLFAPRNATVVTVLFVCAISVAGAAFLILELDGQFEGLITVSAEPLKYALAQLGQ